MTPTQAIDAFGSRSDLADICDVSPTAVYHWVKQGWIPYDKQCLIQVEADRAPKRPRRRLVASWHDIPEERRRAVA